MKVHHTPRGLTRICETSPASCGGLIEGPLPLHREGVLCRPPPPRAGASLKVVVGDVQGRHGSLTSPASCGGLIEGNPKPLSDL